MAWVESHQEIGRHPKTKRAARLAGVSVPTMIGHLHLVWHWALDFAQDGDLSGFDPWQLEDAALWDGAEGVLYGALQGAGFIDTDGDRHVIHDWHDYAGKLIERRKADAERKRGSSGRNPEKRAGGPADGSASVGASPTDVQRNSDGAPPDGAQSPSVTVPLTVPEPYQENGPPSEDGAAAAGAGPTDEGDAPAAVPDGEVFALVDAWASATDRKPKQVQGRERREAFDALKPLAGDIAATDVQACVRWFRSDPFWSDPGKLTVRKLAETLPQWIAQGRPVRVAPKARGTPPPSAPRPPRAPAITTEADQKAFADRFITQLRET
jgi:hypothetical protein